MDLSAYTPRILTAVINIRPVNKRLFTSFFEDNEPSLVDTFELETSYQGQSMLPAISYNDAGTMQNGEVRTLSAVTAPIFKPKRVFTAADKFKRAKGFTPYDTSYDPLEKALAEDLDAHIYDIEFMKEIMCANALVNGKIPLFNKVNGDVKEVAAIDYKRPVSHSVTLSGTAAWDNAGSDLLEQAEQYSSMIMDATGGFGATDLIMGTKAFSAFLKHANVKDLLDNRNINAGSLNINLQSLYRGMWNGLRLWTINASYKDLAGNQKAFIPADGALFIAKDAKLEIDYGLPSDVDCTGPTKIFAKQYKSEDPSAYFTLAESRPLPQVKHAGATVFVKVLEG